MNGSDLSAFLRDTDDRWEECPCGAIQIDSTAFPPCPPARLAHSVRRRSSSWDVGTLLRGGHPTGYPSGHYTSDTTCTLCFAGGFCVGATTRVDTRHGHEAAGCHYSLSAGSRLPTHARARATHTHASTVTAAGAPRGDCWLRGLGGSRAASACGDCWLRGLGGSRASARRALSPGACGARPTLHMPRVSQ